MGIRFITYVILRIDITISGIKAHCINLIFLKILTQLSLTVIYYHMKYLYLRSQFSDQ